MFLESAETRRHRSRLDWPMTGFGWNCYVVRRKSTVGCGEQVYLRLISARQFVLGSTFKPGTIGFLQSQDTALDSTISSPSLLRTSHIRITHKHESCNSERLEILECDNPDSPDTVDRLGQISEIYRTISREYDIGF